MTTETRPHLSATPRIDKLRGLTTTLLALLVEPHPGLVTWRQALAKTIDDIAEFNGHERKS